MELAAEAICSACTERVGAAYDHLILAIWNLGTPKFIYELIHEPYEVIYEMIT